MSNGNNQLDKVIDLLKNGTDLKQLEKGTEKAIEALREADAIIDQYDLPDPWPQLVQYRLAHLLMRNVGEDIELLEEIDQLFKGATKANCLGPLPRLYRLAAMHRLGKNPENMKTVFKSLINQIDCYDENDPGDEYAATYGRITGLQTHFFNMIELAAYFTGYPYSGFEGIGRIREPIPKNTIGSLGMRYGLIEDRNPFSDLLCKLQSWHLVGTVSNLSTKEYPGEIAIAELESRMEKGDISPPCISYKISNDKSIFEWNINLKRVNNDFFWENTSANHLKFITYIYEFSKFQNRNNIFDYISEDDTQNLKDKIRQWKVRCSDAIIKEFNKQEFPDYNINKQNLFLDNKLNKTVTPHFRNDISILGAVDSTLTYT